MVLYVFNKGTSRKIYSGAVLDVKHTNIHMFHVNVFVAYSIICETSASKPIEREVDVSVTDMSRTTVDFVIRGKAKSGISSFVYKVSLPYI